MHSDIYQSVSFKHGMLVDTNKLLHFGTNMSDFDIDSRPQEHKKAENFCMNYLKKF